METGNQGNEQTTAGTQAAAEKTYTLAELNSIVEEKLKSERSKYSDYEALKEKAGKLDSLEEASKSELQKVTEKASKLEAQLNEMKDAAKVQTLRDKIAKETGVPANLLTGDTEDSCKAQAEAIKAFAQMQSGYPSVPDGGEVTNKGKRSTRDQFAEWTQKVLN